MSKHTPGPWRVVWTGIRDAAIRSAHFHIALVTSGLDDDASQPIFKANARLIAAAPELLDALNGMLGLVQLIEHRTDVSGKELQGNHRYRDALALVEKIEGRSTRDIQEGRVEA